jgi:hypothetical protein
MGVRSCPVREPLRDAHDRPIELRDVSAGSVEPQHSQPPPGMRQYDLVDVESVSDELYGLPLDDFTPARNEREKQAKAAGEKDLAAQIHQLTKPNLVAWLANQLARERVDEIRPLLELGAALREATATLSGQQLRELSRQQRQLVYALVQQARRLANAAGRKVSEDTARGLEDTLRAALVDPHAAEALVAGRLTEGMQNSGFWKSRWRGRIGTFGQGTHGGRRTIADCPAARARATQTRRVRRRAGEVGRQQGHHGAPGDLRAARSGGPDGRRNRGSRRASAPRARGGTAGTVESSEGSGTCPGGLCSCRSGRAGRAAAARRLERAYRPLTR